MQDVHSIENGGGGRLFADGGDRRLRPHYHHQDLKCPRCESLNTKFCYYNNYNLSQPRHFCKSCRRYWTNGGVLRNVPVGGGIRKTKRSSNPKSKTGIPSADAAPHERKSSNSGNSSSDSSSLTASTTVANTTATTTPITTREASGNNSTNSRSKLLESSTRFIAIPDRLSTPKTRTFHPLTLNQSSTGNMLSETGTFTSLMTSLTDQLPQDFNMAAGISSFQLHQQNTEPSVEKNQNPNHLQWMHTDVEMPEMGSAGFMDQTGEIELSASDSRRSNGGLAGIEDWQGSSDQALFDLTGAVDQSYWTRSQWNDQHLNYLP